VLLKDRFQLGQRLDPHLGLHLSQMFGEELLELLLDQFLLLGGNLRHRRIDQDRLLDMGRQFPLDELSLQTGELGRRHLLLGGLQLRSEPLQHVRHQNRGAVDCGGDAADILTERRMHSLRIVEGGLFDVGGGEPRRADVGRLSGNRNMFSRRGRAQHRVVGLQRASCAPRIQPQRRCCQQQGPGASCRSGE
jgi:hypothetical protein